MVKLVNCSIREVVAEVPKTAGGFAGFTDALDGASLNGGRAGALLTYPGGGGGAGYYGGGGGGSGDINGHGGGGGSKVPLTRLVSLLVLPQQETIDFLQMVPILIEESLVKAVPKISLALMVNLSSPNK